MSFLHPIISENSEEGDFVISTYILSINTFPKDTDKLIFDLPTEIIVLVDEISIPGTTFDYFNPLLVNTDVLKKISFANRNTLSTVQTFECKSLTCKTLKNLTDIVTKISIQYPPEFVIEYKNMKAYRSPHGAQICSILNSQISQPVSVPRLQPPPPTIRPFPGLIGLPGVPPNLDAYYMMYEEYEEDSEYDSED